MRISVVTRKFGGEKVRIGWVKFQGIVNYWRGKRMSIWRMVEDAGKGLEWIVEV